jgi:hypothetical protein
MRSPEERGRTGENQGEEGLLHGWGSTRDLPV